MDSLRRFYHDRTVRSGFGILVLQVFSFIVPFLSVPWLARVLGTETMGVVLYWQSLALWGGMLVEYGFSLVGGRDVARRETLAAAEATASGLSTGSASLPSVHREMHAETARKIFSARLLLTSLTVVVLVGVWFAVPAYSTDWRFLLWTVVLALAQGFGPAWYFRGIERLTPVISATIIARTGATLLTILLVRDPVQAWLALALQAVLTLIATVVTTIVLHRRVAWRAPTWPAALTGLREGWDVFLVNAASTVYGAASPFLLGLLSTPVAVAHWATAERLNRIFSNVFGVVSAAAFPRISSELVGRPLVAISIAKWLVIGSVALASIVAVPMAILAPWIVNVLYGADYAPAADVLRLLSIQLVLTSVSRVFGILWMIPLGLERALNRVVISASVLYLGLTLWLAPTYGAWGMAIAFVLSETFVLLGEAYQIWRNGYAFWLGTHRQRIVERAQATPQESLLT